MDLWVLAFRVILLYGWLRKMEEINVELHWSTSCELWQKLSTDSCQIYHRKGSKINGNVCFRMELGHYSAYFKHCFQNAFSCLFWQKFWFTGSFSIFGLLYKRVNFEVCIFLFKTESLIFKTKQNKKTSPIQKYCLNNETWVNIITN